MKYDKNMSNGLYKIDDDIVLIDNEDAYIIRACNEAALSRILFNSIKLSSYSEKLNISIYGDKFAEYDANDLLKFANNTGNLEDKIDHILKVLNENNMPCPTLNTIRKISSKLNDAYEPDIIMMKTAQWGGWSGNMSDQARGRGGGSYAVQNGHVNRFYGPASTLPYDTMLDFFRGNRDHWQYSTERKLEDSDIGHKNSQDEKDEYDLSWSERIKKKRLKKLKQMLDNRRLRDQNEHDREPESLGTSEYDNPVALIPLELRLVNKRDINEEDYGVYRRLDEPRPDWYNKKPVRQPLPKPQWNNRRISNIKESQATLGTSYQWDKINPPYRRRPDPGHEYPYGGTGNIGVDQEYWRSGDPATKINIEDFEVSQILDSSQPGRISGGMIPTVDGGLFADSEKDPMNPFITPFLTGDPFRTKEEQSNHHVPLSVILHKMREESDDTEAVQMQDIIDKFNIDNTLEGGLEKYHTDRKYPFTINPEGDEEDGTRKILDKDPYSLSGFKR